MTFCHRENFGGCPSRERGRVLQGVGFVAVRPRAIHGTKCFFFTFSSKNKRGFLRHAVRKFVLFSLFLAVSPLARFIIYLQLSIYGESRATVPRIAGGRFCCPEKPVLYMVPSSGFSSPRSETVLFLMFFGGFAVCLAYYLQLFIYGESGTTVPRIGVRELDPLEFHVVCRGARG